MAKWLLWGTMAWLVLAGPVAAPAGGTTVPEADAALAVARAKYPALVAREWERYGHSLYVAATTGNKDALRAFWAELKAREGVAPEEFLNHLNCHWFQKVAAGHAAPRSAFMLYGKVLSRQGASHVVRAFGSDAYLGRMLLGGPVRPRPLADGVLPAHLVAGQVLWVDQLGSMQVAPGDTFTGAAVPLGRRSVPMGGGQSREQVVVRFLPKVGD